MLKRMISFIMAGIMAVTMLPLQTLAQEMPSEETVIPVESIEQALVETAAMETEEAEITTVPVEETTTATVEAEATAPVEETLPEETILDVVEEAAAAEEDDATVASGTCGENLTWELDDEGTLTISGTGEMEDCYTSPWYEFKDSIFNLVMEDGVTSIGKYAFEDCNSLSSIALPDSLVTIGYSAFRDCDVLTDVTIPEGVISIGQRAFYSCSELSSVTLPDSLTTIGDDAFGWCSVLTSVDIPASVTYIGAYAFTYCAYYRGGDFIIRFVGDAPEFACYGDEDGYYGYPFEDTNTTAYYPGDNATWTEEARQAAGGDVVWVPYGSDGIVQSGSCGENLAWTLGVEGTLTISGTGEMYDYWYNSSPWCGNNGIRAIVVEEGVTSVGAEAFYRCADLTSVSLPDTLTSIGEDAFWGCQALLQIKIPVGVSFIGNRTFSYCPSLTGLFVDPENACYSSDSRGVLFNKDKTSLIMAPCGIAGAYSIPSGVTKIEYPAFNDCGRLTELSIPASVESIENHWVFDHCNNLTAFHVASENANYSSDAYGVLMNKDQTELLRAPMAITGVYNIPASVTSLSEYAFHSCENLTGVTIPDGVTVISGYAFEYCDGLTGITIPASVAYIDYGVFSYCWNLKEIWFRGSAPEFEDPEYGDQFESVMATAYYPADDPSWTETVRQNYGGFLTWTAYDPETTDRGSVILCEEYIALKKGDTAQLHAQVDPVEWSNDVLWSVENDTIATVDSSGVVTAVAQGTTYVIATLFNEDQELTARCRVDVTESLVLEGIQLSTYKLTTELFSTDYAEFEILLQLPQNMAAATAAGSGDLEQEDMRAVAIESAVFTNEAMKGFFELRVLDDRRVAVVPTETAVEWTFYYPEDKDVAGSYVTAVEVSVDGKTYTSENLTLTVNRSKPKLKATVPAFNSFYDDQSQPITVTGGTVTDIYDVDMPEWVQIDGVGMRLTGYVPQKNVSGKATLEIYTEEWRIPATVSVAVKSSYKAPGLKLNASTVTLSQTASDSNGIPMQLQPKTKGVSLADLGIDEIYTDANYWIEEFNPEDGSFLLVPAGDDASEKINLEVFFEDTYNTVTLPLTVKRVPVTLKMSRSAVTLNSATGDAAVVKITATPADYSGFDLYGRLLGSDKSDKSEAGELDFRLEDDGTLYISTTKDTPENAKYTLYLSANGGKEAALKISTTNAEPTLKLKANGNLDLSFPDRKIGLTTTFKNHSGGNLKAIDYTVTESSGKTILDEESKAIRLTKEGADLFVQLKETAGINIKNTYTLNLKLTLADDSVLESSVKIPVKQTNISLKLSANKLTLNKAIDDKATVTVTCATKDYSFTEPVWALLDSKGREVETGILDISWADGKLTVATTEATPYGASYKLQVSPEEGAKAVALAIVIPAEAKSTVTGTLKATGNLDVIRDGTALTVTPTWKNCNDAERTETLTIRNGSGEDVTANFSITEEDGKYILTRGEDLDHTQKYTATLAATFANGTTATASGALKLKMGSAKLTVKADSTTLFANDKHSRVNISFASADSTLNKVANVTLDPKLANQFELFDYGNGQYAIGFKDEIVPAKLTAVNLVLNVWLESNETAKANASVKVKLSIVR